MKCPPHWQTGSFYPTMWNLSTLCLGLRKQSQWTHWPMTWQRHTNPQHLPLQIAESTGELPGFLVSSPVRSAPARGRLQFCSGPVRPSTAGKLMQCKQSQPVFIFMRRDRSRRLLYFILKGTDWQRTCFVKNKLNIEEKKVWIFTFHLEWLLTEKWISGLTLWSI